MVQFISDGFQPVVSACPLKALVDFTPFLFNETFCFAAGQFGIAHPKVFPNLFHHRQDKAAVGPEQSPFGRDIKKFRALDHLADGIAQRLIKNIFHRFGKELSSRFGAQKFRGIHKKAVAGFHQEVFRENGAQNRNSHRFHGIGHHLHVSE